MAQPVTIEAEFGGKDVFVDITTRCISMSVRRGRDDYTQPFRAGTGTIVARNLDGELDPDNTTGTYYGEILTGRRIRITSNKNNLLYERVIYVGFITDLALSYDLSGQASATISCIDGLGELAQTQIPNTAVSAETTGSRVATILALPEVDYQYATDLDTGYSSCAAGTASGNTLSYLFQVATTEQGALYVDRAGTLQFKDRYELLNPSTLTFTDTGSGTNYEAITRGVTQTELYNQLAANRQGQADVVRDNTTNQGTYGIRFLDLGDVFFATNAEVTDMLDYALVRYSSTSPRVTDITTFLDPKSQLAVSQLVQLDLADSVTVEFTPPNVAQIVLQSSIESIEHNYTYGGGWRLSFGLTPRDTSSYLVLNDSVLGRLDFNVLAF
jgi:hypothetical protein